jgi:hypothetical protein
MQRRHKVHRTCCKPPAAAIADMPPPEAIDCSIDWNQNRLCGSSLA